MRPTDERILAVCHLRQESIQGTPRPADWQSWLIREWEADREHGPRYSPTAWFGELSDAERQNFMRGVYRLAAAGLLVLFKSEGGKLQRVKLTPAGETKAAELTAGMEASVDG